MLPCDERDTEKSDHSGRDHSCTMVYFPRWEMGERSRPVYPPELRERVLAAGSQLDAYRRGFRSSYRHHGVAIANGSDGRTRPVRLTELRIGVNSRLRTTSSDPTVLVRKV